MDQVVRPIGPHGSVERPVRCLFCGAISAWWVCGCEWSQRIRDGKLARPRTVMRGGVPVIVLCDELREAARVAGVITGEYRRAAGGENAPNHGVEPRYGKGEVRVSAEVSVTPSVAVTGDVTAVTAKCEECGKRIASLKSTARYCSAACRMRAHRRG